MRIVFHGNLAASFSYGFAALLGSPAQIVIVPDELQTEAQRNEFAAADVIIGIRFDASMPRPERLRLFQLPAAGYDAMDLAALPPDATVCNCFGHETAIAEYVMAALLRRCVPLDDADRRLRKGEWPYWAGGPGEPHAEIEGSTIGLLGFGHIGKAVARRARAFGMRVHVANRSVVPESDTVDRYFPLSALPEFWGSADAIVVTVPLAVDTQGLVGADAFAAMRANAVLVNVARGPVVDETAMYEALRGNSIAGAVIDTWYRYPTPTEPHALPSTLPFHELPNVLMTPHMSGWTNGTMRRRQEAMAENIGRRMRGEPCVNVIRG
jgi:phosphoglycerate dehydrogenase-like enzyme